LKDFDGIPYFTSQYMKLFSLFLFLIIISANTAYCCTVAPQEKALAQLVTSNSQIVVARFIRAEHRQHSYTFHFEVIKTLKGRPLSQTSLESCCNFVSTDTDCSIHPGGFARGGEYLLFLNKPYDYKSFRPLIGEVDSWLGEVTREIQKQEKDHTSL
jgi:hypothetical protein